jgi:hypothetical protein
MGHAALALRHREIVAEQASARRVRMLADARAGQLTWVVLEEAGDPAGDPMSPYRRLEAAPATGRAMLVTATPAEDFRTCLHCAQAGRVDLDTGRVDVPVETDEQPLRWPSAAEREAHVARMRAALASGG